MSFIVPSRILTPCIISDNTKHNDIPIITFNSSLNIYIFQKSFFSDSMWDGWYQTQQCTLYFTLPPLRLSEEWERRLTQLLQMEKKSDSRHDPCMNVLLNSDGLKQKTCFNIAFRFRGEVEKWCRTMIRIAQKVPDYFLFRVWKCSGSSH